MAELVKRRFVEEVVSEGRPELPQGLSKEVRVHKRYSTPSLRRRGLEGDALAAYMPAVWSSRNRIDN
jgi:hypothetical protein